MEHEPIYMNGVDVSGCVYRDSENRCCCDSSKKNEGEERLTGRGGCAYNPNCHFKQLAHKTQEYNDLLEQHKELDDRANKMIEEKYNLARECEEYLKQRNNILEESKRYLEEIRKLQKSQFCVAYEKDCYKVCKQQNCAIKNSYRYRKTLEEIEEYVKTTIRMPLERKVILDIIGKAKEEK